MRDCWETQPELRPSFSELVTRLSSHLDGMAGYLDFFTSAGNFYEIAVESESASVGKNGAESDAEYAVIEESSALTCSTTGTEATLTAVSNTVGLFKTPTLESSNVIADAEDCL